MKIVSILQIIVSILLMIFILMQNRGSGLSASMGGDAWGYYTKRGLEKFFFYASVILAAAFIGLAIAGFWFSTRV